MGDGETLLVLTSLQVAQKSWQGARVCDGAAKEASGASGEKKRQSRESEKVRKAGLLK